MVDLVQKAFLLLSDTFLAPDDCRIPFRTALCRHQSLMLQTAQKSIHRVFVPPLRQGIHHLALRGCALLPENFHHLPFAVGNFVIHIRSPLLAYSCSPFLLYYKCRLILSSKILPKGNKKRPTNGLLYKPLIYKPIILL